MNDIKYILVNEPKPNSFEPIYWSLFGCYDLKLIDNFTSKYSKEELENYLIDNNMLLNHDNKKSFEIIYYDNGNRKLKYGVLYKEDLVEDMVFYIEEFIKNNQSNSQILNDLNQKVQSENIINDVTKELIKMIFNNRNCEYNELRQLIIKLYNCSYVDIRTIYLTINKELKPKLAKKLILSKQNDEN